MAITKETKVRQPFLRIVLRILFYTLGLVILFVIVFSGELFNRDKIEIARRVVCHSNMKKLATILQEKDINLSDSNANLIGNIIKENDFLCPSGSVVHVNKDLCFYYMDSLPDGRKIITENVENHDTSHMTFADVKYVRYYLYYDFKSGKYVVDKWESKVDMELSSASK